MHSSNIEFICFSAAAIWRSCSITSIWNKLELSVKTTITCHNRQCQCVTMDITADWGTQIERKLCQKQLDVYQVLLHSIKNVQIALYTLLWRPTKSMLTPKYPLEILLQYNKNIDHIMNAVQRCWTFGSISLMTLRKAGVELKGCGTCIRLVMQSLVLVQIQSRPLFPWARNVIHAAHYWMVQRHVLKCPTQARTFFMIHQTFVKFTHWSNAPGQKILFWAREAS